MDWNEILNTIIKVSLVPLLTTLTGFLVNFIKVKANDIKARAKSETGQKYIDLLSQTISNCVLATNQTYVDALKEQNVFDAEAQKEAFRRTYKSVMAILTQEAKVYLDNIYGDLNAYITEKIEAEVNLNHQYLEYNNDEEEI